MRIMRSFPYPAERDATGRAYVVDSLERFYMRQYDYRELRHIDDDIVLLEWDIAVDDLMLRRFVERCQGRDWPLVAPYYKAENGAIYWMHLRKTADGFRNVFEGEPDCDQFGLGLCYLPGGLLRDCPDRDRFGSRVTDGLISRYLRSRPDWRPVPIAWDITVTHLH